MNQVSPSGGAGAMAQFPSVHGQQGFLQQLRHVDPDSARRWFEEVLKAAQAGLEAWTDAELVARFLAQASPSGSRETVDGYRRELAHLARWMEQNHPGMPIRSVCPSVAEHLVADLRAKVNAGEIKPRTFNRRLACWSSLFRWASEPCRAALSGVIRSPFGRRLFLKVEKLSRPLAEAELADLTGTISHAARTGLRTARRDLVLVRTAFLCGLRISELTHLRWSDIEPVEGGAIVHVRRGKGGRTRAIRISPATLAMIEGLGRGEPEGWVFPSARRQGQPITRQAAGDRCRRWGQQIGIALWPHRLRHTHASMAVRAGVDTFTLMATMGHRSAETTSGYVRSCPSTSSSLALG